jgi:hypothetical protein
VRVGLITPTTASSRARHSANSANFQAKWF